MAMRMPELVERPSRDRALVKPHRYCRTPAPLYFPATEKVPETKENMERRTALYQSVKRELAASATIGSDQFVYWDATSTKKRLAPDVFVRLGQPDETFRVWKTWERGAPDLGVEIVSTADEGAPEWEEKLARYYAAGVSEIVRFDPENRTRPLRIWDLISGDLVERAHDDPDLRFCETLHLWWVIALDETLGPTLRLARDRRGRQLLPTPDEVAAEAQEAEAKARAAETKARENEAKAREAEARAREAETMAREAEARARGENERLQAELAALRAERAGEGPKPRKRRG
jgi:Uma2 family endonuclease